MCYMPTFNIFLRSGCLRILLEYRHRFYVDIFMLMYVFYTRVCIFYIVALRVCFMSIFLYVNILIMCSSCICLQTYFWCDKYMDLFYKWMCILQTAIFCMHIFYMSEASPQKGPYPNEDFRNSFCLATLWCKQLNF